MNDNSTRDLTLVPSGEEFHDVTLSKAQKEQLKSLVKRWEKRLNHYQLMYLSCAFEDAARRKKSGDKS